MDGLLEMPTSDGPTAWDGTYRLFSADRYRSHRSHHGFLLWSRLHRRSTDGGDLLRRKSPTTLQAGEELGEGRFELLRHQHDRLELLREERRVLLDEFERERRERLETQERVKQLMREHPHLEFERELQRLTEALELEREGRKYNHRERQRLGEELGRERLARGSAERPTP
jgi:hypothetical protein